MSRSLGVTRELHHIIPDYLIPFFLLVTYLGSPAFLFLLYMSYYYLEPGRKGRFIVALGLLSIAFIDPLKQILGLPRPPSSLSRVAATGYGFPSGHAFRSTVAWFSLAQITTFSTRNKRFMVAGLLTGLVSLSRLALGAHYFADVSVGTVLGLGVCYAAFKIYDKNPKSTVTTGALFAVPGGFLMSWGREYSLIFGAVFGAAVYIYLRDSDITLTRYTGVNDGGRTPLEVISTFVLGGVLVAAASLLFGAIEMRVSLAIASLLLTYILLSIPGWLNRFSEQSTGN